MNITATREAMGLNKSELAEKLGVSPSTISRLENGEIPLSTRTAVAIRWLAKSMHAKVIEQ